MTPPPRRHAFATIHAAFRFFFMRVFYDYLLRAIVTPRQRPATRAAQLPRYAADYRHARARRAV